MTDQSQTIHLANQVCQKADDFPQPLVQCALMLLAEPESENMQAMFLEVYQHSRAIMSMSVGEGLPYPPDAARYYTSSELSQPGIVIGVEPVNGWTLKLFPEQLRRHCIILGMTGSGKTNLLQLIALGLGEIDK